MVEKVKQFIKNKYGKDLTINSIFRTGGHLFCENCKDYDYVVIVNEDIKRTKYYDKETNTDYFIYSQSERNRELEMDLNLHHTIYVINEIFKPYNTIYGDSTCKLDLFFKEEEYKEVLRNKLLKSSLSENITWENCEFYCHKTLWWAICGLLMLENRSYEITNEMKEVIQMCHDGVLPKKWEYWVRQKLNLI